MTQDIDTSDDDQRFHVVVNDEEQYSIWFADRTPPAGWQIVGDAAPKQECLDRIATLWTDMRPRSLREQLDAARAADGQ
jgi:MbtH protein